MGLSSDSVALVGSRSDSPSEQSELILRFPKPRTDTGGEELGQELSKRVSQCSGYSVWNFTNPPGQEPKTQTSHIYTFKYFFFLKVQPYIKVYLNHISMENRCRVLRLAVL